jgi:hypothetical protein
MKIQKRFNFDSYETYGLCCPFCTDSNTDILFDIREIETNMDVPVFSIREYKWEGKLYFSCCCLYLEESFDSTFMDAYNAYNYNKEYFSEMIKQENIDYLNKEYNEKLEIIKNKIIKLYQVFEDNNLKAFYDFWGEVNK